MNWIMSHHHHHSWWISWFPRFVQHHSHRAGLDRWSHVQQHSLLFCCLAGWLSTLCRERLDNNLSAPVGYEASMSTTGLVFHRPPMEIRKRGWSGYSADRGVCGGGSRGSKGERVVFLGLSQGGTAWLCFATIPTIKDWEKGSSMSCFPAAALALRQPILRVYLFLHITTCKAFPSMQTTSCVFYIWEVLCKSAPSSAARKANLEIYRHNWFQTCGTQHVFSYCERSKALWARKPFEYSGRLTPSVISCSNSPQLHNVPAAHTAAGSSTFPPSPAEIYTWFGAFSPRPPQLQNTDMFCISVCISEVPDFSPTGKRDWSRVGAAD